MPETAAIEFARHKSARCAAPCDTERDYEEHLGGRHRCARVRGHAIRSQDPDHICRCGHLWSAESPVGASAGPPESPAVQGEAREAQEGRNG